MKNILLTKFGYKLILKLKKMYFRSAIHFKTNRNNLLKMKAHTASLINAVLLIILSLWGFLDSDKPPVEKITALIPGFVGVVLLVMNPGVKKENKVIAHIAVLLTLLILFALIKPFSGAIKPLISDDGAQVNIKKIVRLILMISSTLVAMIFFVKSFIDARKRREKEAAEALDSSEGN